VVFVFAQLPQAFNQSKQKIEQPWRGADGKQREENANRVFRAVAKYVLHSDTDFTCCSFCKAGNPFN
jgi:hypothetical protein